MAAVPTRILLLIDQPISVRKLVLVVRRQLFRKHGARLLVILFLCFADVFDKISA
jgi:hypothetical protein